MEALSTVLFMTDEGVIRSVFWGSFLMLQLAEERLFATIYRLCM